MKIDGRRKRSERRGRSATKEREWVGGRVVSPFYITQGTPYRPDLVLWLELPERVVVSFNLSDPREEPVSFGATFLETMESPLIGPPRRPNIVRVVDARLAAEVRRVLPDVRVVQAPTPEVHQVAELMAESASDDESSEADGGEEASYFEAGRARRSPSRCGTPRGNAVHIRRCCFQPRVPAIGRMCRSVTASWPPADRGNSRISPWMSGAR